MKRNKNIASFLFSVFSAGMLSQALMSSASGTDILETEKLVKKAKLQQNGSSTDDEISNNGNREEEVQDIGANDNDDANSAATVYIDRNKVNGALANKQLIKVASFLLPTLGVGALGVGALSGSGYHFLKKEDKNKEPSEVNTEVKYEDEPNEEDTKIKKEDKNKEPSEVNTEVKDEDEPNLEDTMGEKEDNKVTGDQNEVNNEVKDKDELKKEDTKIKKEDNKVTDNQDTLTSVWCCYVIMIVVGSAVYFYYTKSLCGLLDKFNAALKKDPACVKIKGKTIVVGDLHFNTGAALFVKDYYETKINEGYNLVFLGDFIDRGQQAKYGTIYKEDGETEDEVATAKWRLKTLEIIMGLKIKYPKKVIVLSGNHEADGGVNYLYGFRGGCKKAFGEADGEKVYNKANEVFGELPKCAVLEQKDKDGKDLNTFLVHGTVPYDPNGKMDLKDIVEKMADLNKKKFYKYEGQPEKERYRMVSGMVWNDYKNGNGTERGEGVCNLEDSDVELFKKANNIQRVISGHDHTEPYVEYNNGEYIKVITSPNMNWDGKDGFILDIDEYGTIKQVKVEEVKVEEVSYKKFKQQEANNANNINNEVFNNNIDIISQNNNIN